MPAAANEGLRLHWESEGELPNLISQVAHR